MVSIIVPRKSFTGYLVLVATSREVMPKGASNLGPWHEITNHVN